MTISTSTGRNGRTLTCVTLEKNRHRNEPLDVSIGDVTPIGHRRQDTSQEEQLLLAKRGTTDLWQYGHSYMRSGVAKFGRERSVRSSSQCERSGHIITAAGGTGRRSIA